MKEIIAFIAIFLLLLWTAMQPVVNEINYTHMAVVQNIVYSAAQKARTDGYFTTTNIAGIKNDITTAFPQITAVEITVTATTTPKYRTDAFDDREMIDFNVKIPIKKIIAMQPFFGLTDAQNKMDYAVDGHVPSEKLP